ncbi:MAG: hypothetical protein M3R13_02660 [Armatimonadota bacterium]|nr:hypothetical protein [Armatimonadota bacterium]
MKGRAVVLVFLAVAACQAQYNAHVLHSPAVPSPFSFGAGAGGGQQVGHTNIILNGPSNALLWSGTAGSLVNLHPAGFAASYAMDTDGTNQIGWRVVAGFGAFATMWSGTAESWVNLNHPKYLGSIARGIGGGQQVGEGVPLGQHPDLYEALLWHGTAESQVNLHPGPEFDRSSASATDGKQQVGVVSHPSTERNAALWSGTGQSFVNLDPVGIGESWAEGVAKGQQVGSALFPNTPVVAALWQDSSETFINLNPNLAPNLGSQAFDTNGFQQVGIAGFPVKEFAQIHATAWNGTPESYMDLHDFLPSQHHGEGAESWAQGIDEFGNIVGWAADLKDGGRQKAVLWTPVPEPSSAIALTAGLLLLAAHRLRRTAHKR